MTPLAKLIAWLNTGMSSLFNLLEGPFSALPPLLTLVVISGLLGVAMLILFKYTSNQTAIGRVRDKIKANLLTMKLFKDDIPVVLRSQFRVFGASILLLVYSLPPLVFMVLPFCLVMGQLGVWYQANPLDVKEQAVVMMQLSDSVNPSGLSVSMEETQAFEVMTGPVRAPAKKQIFWKIQANEAGIHEMRFNIGDTRIKKELSVGSDFMPVSIKRPALSIGDLILYPAEQPFDAISPVKSVEIHYPDRPGLLTGSGNWVLTLFVVSMLAGLAVKSTFNVKI